MSGQRCPWRLLGAGHGTGIVSQMVSSLSLTKPKLLLHQPNTMAWQEHRKSPCAVRWGPLMQHNSFIPFSKTPSSNSTEEKIWWTSCKQAQIYLLFKEAVVEVIHKSKATKYTINRLHVIIFFLKLGVMMWKLSESKLSLMFKKKRKNPDKKIQRRPWREGSYASRPDNKNKIPRKLQSCTKAVATLHKKYFCGDIYPATTCPTYNWHRPCCRSL